MEVKSSQQDKSIKEYRCLTYFENICPPKGSQGVILFKSSLRGIRKTFHDCNTIKGVSLHLEYREELQKNFGGKVIPLKLFIIERYIGGVDEVIRLHEMDCLGQLLDGIPVEVVDNPCKGCTCMLYAICTNCVI